MITYGSMSFKSLKLSKDLQEILTRTAMEFKDFKYFAKEDVEMLWNA